MLYFAPNFSVNLLSLQKNLKQELLFRILQITVQLPLYSCETFDQRAAVDVQLLRCLRIRHAVAKEDPQRVQIGNWAGFIMLYQILKLF